GFFSIRWTMQWRMGMAVSRLESNGWGSLPESGSRGDGDEGVADAGSPTRRTSMTRAGSGASLLAGASMGTER
ncbi:hypothetical protein, partial [Stutzerimonas nitrititolerans]|uniref:hypothetical protein n=1 Tax=Stutzerimonas nitrititolerans TaxID=2482751 RepID=UPI0028A054CD